MRRLSEMDLELTHGIGYNEKTGMIPGAAVARRLVSAGIKSEGNINMKKKRNFTVFTALVLAICLFCAAGLSGCGAGDVTDGTVPSSSEASQPESTASTAASEPERTPDLAGLAARLEYLGYVSRGENDANVKTPKYDFIGAIDGVRYSGVRVGSSVFNIELYQYDPNNLNETAQRYLDEVKSTGKITVLENFDSISAMLSDNGKYLLIYSDGSTDEENLQYKAKVEEVVKTYE